MKLQIPPSKWILSSSLIAMLATLLLVGIFMSPSDEERVAASETQVASLFIEGSDIIRPDLNQEDIDAAEESLRYTPLSQRDPLESKLEGAYQQQDALNILNQVIQSHPTGDEEIILHPHVDQELIDKTEQDLAQLNHSSIEEYDQRLDQAQGIYTELQAGLEKLEEYKSYEVITRSNLHEVIEVVNEATVILGDHIHQPYLATDAVNFHGEIENFSKTLVNGYRYGSYGEETMGAILSNPILSEHLKGTPLRSTPLIALTFDDGPNLNITPQVLDLLAQYDAVGTFFVYGAYVDDHPEMAQRIVNEGHILANHSYSHPDFASISDAEVLQQIEWTQESIYDATGYESTLYRMPFGSGGYRVVELLPDMTSITWNLDSLDWQLQDSQLIYDRVMSGLTNDTLLLMHDTHQATVDALEMILPELVEMGYEFVLPTELAYNQTYY